MTLSEDIQKSIDLLQVQYNTVNAEYQNVSSSTCFNTQGCIRRQLSSDATSKKAHELYTQIDGLIRKKEIQLQNEINEIKIETKLDIPPNPLNQLGESIEPAITQIKKPENQGLLLLAGLVAAAIIIN